MPYVISIILTLAAFFWVNPVTAQEPPQDSTTQSSTGAAAKSQLSLDDMRTFTDVFNQVRRNYVEEVDDKFLLDAAIQGMLSDLDPHSAYLPNSEYEDLEQSSKGQYVGIGVDVAAENGRVVVKAVITPSPADSAGIDPGDIITSVDDVPVKGRPLREAIDDLSGPPGSTVELSITSPGGEKRTLVLERQVIKVPALSFRLLDQTIGYFRIVYFHHESAADLQQSIESVLADGIELEGVILDLRNNPGGVLQPAIEIADGFLDEGEIVTTRGRNASMQMSFTAQQGQWLPGVPLVVLVDRGSASASEVLAGALQDNGRAVIVGERTFGKGSVQSVLPLRNGSGLKLTTARYYTPSGRSIQALGIDPDIPVASAVQVVDYVDGRKLEADLDGHLDNELENADQAAFSTVSIEEDYPLYEALNLLRATQIISGGKAASFR